MFLPPDFVELLRSRIAPSDVVGKRIKLHRKAQGEYLGLCPFHGEKTPSFTVSDTKGFYHCFGCGVHGDIVKFVMETEGRSFAEAAQQLAEQHGIPLPHVDKHTIEKHKRALTLYDVMEEATLWFESRFKYGGGQSASDYLQQRGIHGETISQFRLGASPNERTALKRHLLKKNFTEAQMIETGLIIQPENGRDSYDRFRDRIMFPIRDAKGKVIAFGGRILGDGKPKYLNSPETPIFHKGHVLYNIDQARQPAYEKEQIIAVEGYMDVIALAQAGFSNAVAPLGTAITEHHLHQLWKICDEPTLCMDGDSAGKRAMHRAATLALPHLAPGKTLKFVSLPNGNDPDDIIKQHGVAKMQEHLSSTIPLTDIIWEISKPENLVSPEHYAFFEATLFSHIDNIENESIQQHYRRHFKNRLWEASRDQGRENAREFTPKKFGKKSAPARLKLSQAPKQTTNQTLLNESHLLFTIINHPDLLNNGHIEDNFMHLDFSDSNYSTMQHTILDLISGSPSISHLDLVTELKKNAVFSDIITGLQSNRFIDSFTHPETTKNMTLLGWDFIFSRLQYQRISSEYDVLTRAANDDDALAHLEQLKKEKESLFSISKEKEIAYIDALEDLM